MKKVIWLGCLVGFVLWTIVPSVQVCVQRSCSSLLQIKAASWWRSSSKQDDIQSRNANFRGPELGKRIQYSAELSRDLKKIKVMCWVPSRSAQGPALDRIVHTWASSCDKLIFTSTSANPELNVVKISYPLDQSLWNMIHPAWNYLEENHLQEYDWFVKVDDDSFFSGDNFKWLVRNMNSDDRYYLGHTAYSPAGRHSREAFNLGAGHALSRGSLRWLGPFLPDSKKPLPPGYNQKCARTISWAEDIQLNECLFVAGIGGPHESRDAWGRESFLSFTPVANFLTVRRNDSKSWFWKGKPNNTGSGASCCSSRPILWHGLKGDCAGCHFYINYFLNNVALDPIGALSPD